MRARNRNAQSMNNASSRNVALDLMRGLTIALMIIVNNPGDWKNMFSLLEHADWNGFLGADIVFPFFLFVAGFAAALKIERVYGEIRAAGPHCASALTLGDGLRSSKPYIFPLLRRTAILFLIGLFLNGWPFGLLPGTEFSPQNLRLFWRDAEDCNIGYARRAYIALCAVQNSPCHLHGLDGFAL
jgi:predicted acyltransferase